MPLGGSGRHPAQRYLAQARHSAERGARLTRDLLAFARRAKPRCRTARRERRMSERRGAAAPLGRVGMVRIDQSSARPICGRRWPMSSQIELVILNLAINARDAMPGGGTITIGDRRTSAADDPHRPAELSEGDYVRLAVSDTGRGHEQGSAREMPGAVLHDKGDRQGIGSRPPGGARHRDAKRRRPSRSAASRAEGLSSASICRAPRRIWCKARAAEPASNRAERRPIGARVLLVDDDPDVRDILTAQLSGPRLRRCRG